jgi:DNA modification methylase
MKTIEAVIKQGDCLTVLQDYPSKVLHLATETGNRNHSATFPHDLPEWFIKLFTREDDWVLDPFVGCGTVSEVAQQLKRNSVGIDVLPEYIALARSKIKEKEMLPCEKLATYATNNKKRNHRVYRAQHSTVSQTKAR